MERPVQRGRHRLSRRSDGPTASSDAARLRRLTPYLFLVPGGLWLIVFFVVPMLVMASVSLQEGSLGTGYPLTWNFGVYPEVISRLDAAVRPLARATR